MKKCFVFLLYLVLVVDASFAKSKIPCDIILNQDNLKNTDYPKIKHINVKIDNFRKWTENSLNILIGNFRWIPNKFKKRFDSNVVVKFENNLVCNFRARIRNNGNQKDHIALKGNSIIQSIDVHLKNGHIYGITKFKLLRPNTRGNYEDEILLTELLREFNYLSPRTSLVDVEINKVESKMLFQEKPDKAMLEFNLRKIGPLYEGDERFYFRLAKNQPDNQLSNYSLGMMPLLEKGANAMLARQINSEWSASSKENFMVSYNSLSHLNLAYLLYTNKKKDEKNNFNYSTYTLDNNLLALNNPKNILKLDTYNLILFATNGWHGLEVNNRKFYWNMDENFFEPVNSDTNANIDLESNILLFPLSDKINLAFNNLEKLLDLLNIELINQKTNLRGLNLSVNQIEKKINKIEENLYKIKKMYLETDPKIISYNQNYKFEKKMWNKYYESLYQINPNIYLVKRSSKNNLFERCEIKPLKCTDYNFDKKQLMDLAEGRLIIEGREYQYLGKNFNDL